MALLVLRCGERDCFRSAFKELVRVSRRPITLYDTLGSRMSKQLHIQYFERSCVLA